MTHLAVLVALSSFSLAAASIREKPMDDRELQRMARTAKTAGEHQEVAGHYEARGRYFEAKATKHEQDANELAQRDGYNPMKYKWPAMVQAPIDKARGQAMQARRAARECFEWMAKHREQAARLSGPSAE